MTITPAPAALGITLSDWVDELTEEYLSRRDKAPLDLLASALTTTATAITVQYGDSGLRAQTRVEIDDELIHLWAESSSAKTFTVQRGMSGSTAAAHDDKAMIRVGPRWPRIVIARQLEREIRSWPTAIYAVASGEFAVDASTETVDLTGLSTYEIIRLCRVQRDHARANDGSWPTIPASLERNQANEFTSGYALRLHGVIEKGTTLRVAIGYRHPIPAIDMSADLGTAYHLSGALADAAMLGVAGRLLLTDEVDRTDDRSQPRPRRAEDVPPGHRLQTGQALLVERDRLLQREAERLTSAYTPSY